MKYELKENKTGAVTPFTTLLETRYENNELIFNFMAHKSAFNSYSNKYNDDIYKGDVVEVFLYTGIKDQYYEIEVAPNGTLFFGDIYNDGKEIKLTKLINDAIVPEAQTFDDGHYEVNIKINLRYLKGDKKEIFFNAYRIETEGICSDKNLLAVNPTLCGSFHKRESFIKLEK